MSGTNIVLDTNAVLYLLGGSLDPMSLPKGEYFISFITELELLSYPNLSKSEEEKIKIFFDSVDVIGLNADIKRETIHLKRKYKIKLPDAIICATALFLKASFLTFDRNFKKIKEVTLIEADLS
ncbi:MAG: type II toxin-antitoxin system VapC family toxin [Ignavibacteriaceae bacterium]|nr:type II toxin-antitoxin system VapC family toxin [Ignavibacteriaceae bacterium]